MEVCITVHSNCLDPQTLSGALDTASNLSAISDENLVKQTRLTSGACRGKAPATGDCEATHETDPGVSNRLMKIENISETISLQWAVSVDNVQR